MNTSVKLFKDAKEIHQRMEQIWSLQTETRSHTPEELAEYDKLAAQYEAKITEARAQESRENLRNRVLQENAEPRGRIGHSLPTDDVSVSERYSVLRALSILATGRQLDGIEGETSQEISRKIGKSPQGFWLPNNLRWSPRNVIESRAGLEASGVTGVRDLDIRYDRFVDVLRNKMLVFALGAEIVSDLIGSVQIPMQTASSQAQWVADGGTATAISSPTIGQIALTEKRLVAFTEYRMSVLFQTSMDLEAWVRADMAKAMALELDRAALNGSGASGQPTGILVDTNVPTIALGTNGAAPTWGNIVSMETGLDSSNAMGVFKPAFLTTPKGRGQLKTTVQVAGSTTDFIWGRDDRVNTYAAYSTNQLPSNLTKGTSSGVCSSAILGDFTNIFYGMWGATDVVVNPYTGDLQRTVRVSTWMHGVDIVNRYPTAFRKMVDILTPNVN